MKAEDVPPIEVLAGWDIESTPAALAKDLAKYRGRSWPSGKAGAQLTAATAVLERVEAVIKAYLEYTRTPWLLALSSLLRAAEAMHEHRAGLAALQTEASEALQGVRRLVEATSGYSGGELSAKNSAAVRVLDAVDELRDAGVARELLHPDLLAILAGHVDGRRGQRAFPLRDELTHILVTGGWSYPQVATRLRPAVRAEDWEGVLRHGKSRAARVKH